MREIKFRAWDKWNKQYFEDLNNIFITGNGEIGIVDKSGRNLIEEYQERFVSEFSTGLKDKNGVEIYENDVVKINNDYDFIEFQDYSFCTHNQHEPLANYVYDTVSGDPKFLDDVFEVVGNIHENADLLEEQS